MSDPTTARSIGSIIKVFALSVVFMTVSMAGTAAAQTIRFVDASATPGGDGQTWATAYADLQTALDNVTNGEIWVKAGTYYPTNQVGGSGERYRTFQMKNNVAIYGGFAGTEDPATFDLDDRDFEVNETILSGDIGTPGYNSDNCYHVFYHPDGRNLDNTAILDGFTITGGNANVGWPYYHGGGMHNFLSSPTLRNCIFRSNSASSRGGGIYNFSHDSTTMTNCVFVGNSASDGGGMHAVWGNPILTNCTFIENVGNTDGGGMYLLNSDPTLTNCIVWGNVAPNGPQMYNDSSTPIVSYSCVEGGYAGTGNISTDPRFIRNPYPGQDGDFDGVHDDYGDLRLRIGSPCIDAGDNDALGLAGVSTDLEGNERFIDSPFTPDTGNPGATGPPIVDMGAYEGEHGSFEVSEDLVVIQEGATAELTVVLADTPRGTLQVSVTFDTGDTDITIQSGMLLTFDETNYDEPQAVTLAAAEDSDRIEGTARLVVSAPGFVSYTVDAQEIENDNHVFVDGQATGAGDGTSWEDAFTDLSDALSFAAGNPTGETIWVKAGTYYPTNEVGGIFIRYRAFQLRNNVAVYGGFAGTEDPATFDLADRDFVANETILSGDIGTPGDATDNCFHVFNHPDDLQLDGSAVLDGFTITGASSETSFSSPEADGGGMYNDGSSPTVANCIFTGNSARYGSGMYNSGYSTTPTLVNCTFTDNSANHGGGMCNELQASPTLTNCTFAENSASYGGGMYNGWFSKPTLTYCTFIENTAFSQGGAMHCWESKPSLTSCRLIGNSAGDEGGAIYNQSLLSAILTNCTFTANSAGQRGGGMFNKSAIPELTNCTFAANSAIRGGGLFNVDTQGGVRPDGPTLINCILWGNTAIGGAQVYNENSTPSIHFSCIEGGYGGAGNISISPQFVRDPDPGPDGEWDGIDDNYGDLRLRPGSPCIDAGYNNTSGLSGISTDLDGGDRFYNDKLTPNTGAPSYVSNQVDMGPYERRQHSIALVNSQATGAANGTTWADAYTDLQTALANVSSGRIWVKAGTYYPSVEVGGSGPRFQTFQLKNNVSLYGGFTGNEHPWFDIPDRDLEANPTILSGDIGVPGDNSDNCYHVFYHPADLALDTDVVLDGFTIIGGNANGSEPHNSGGGMYNESASLTVANCLFNGNVASAFGGGMSNESGSPTLINCAFGANAALNGAGLSFSDSNSPTLINCTLSGNPAGDSGGGIYSSSSGLVLVNCILGGNSAPNGPQIQSDDPSPEVTYSCIQGGYDGAGNIGTNPQLVRVPYPGPDGNFDGVDDDYGNLRLAAQSPGIDAGDSVAIGLLEIYADLDGNDRFIDDPLVPDTGTYYIYGDPVVDMGAYEGWHQGFIVSPNPVLIPEGGTAQFTVGLAANPLGPVEVSVAFEAGDSDITLQSGAILNFDDTNYDQPQTVTLAAAEDADKLEGTASFAVIASGIANSRAVAREVEKDLIVLFVDSQASGAADGSSWADAFTDVSAALSTAAGDPTVDQIWIKAGTYYPSQEIGGSGPRYRSFQLVNNLAVLGGFAGNEDPATFDLADRDFEINETILSGDIGTAGDNSDNCYHVFNHPAALELNDTSILDGVTITGGNADGGTPQNRGGGMYNASCSPKLLNCEFRKNRGSLGGGMFNDAGSPTLIHCTFTANLGYNYGGGMLNFNASRPELINCLLQGNNASSGGAVFNRNDSSPLITNCTFYGNSADNQGGGISNLLGSDPTLTNCIFWMNTAPDGPLVYNDSSSTPVVSYSCIEGGYIGTGNIDTDPLFVRLPDPGQDGQWDGVDDDYGDLRLMAGSPCIDAGDNNASGLAGITIDLAGLARFFDDPATADTGNGSAPIVDMGAYEYQPAPPNGDLDNDDDVDADDFDLFLIALGHSTADPSYNPAADMDGDGTVTFVDYQQWMQAYRDAIGQPTAPAPIEVLGDFDRSLSVDSIDLQHFLDCSAGPGVPVDPATCSDADLDGDQDADQADFGILQRCRTKNGETINLNCKY